MGRPARFKNAIYEAAIRLFGAQGLNQTGIREIAKVAGVSEAALYRHWKGKRELAWDIFKRGLEELHDAMSSQVHPDRPFCEAAHTVVRVFFEAYDRNPQLFGYLLLSQHELWKSKPADLSDPVAFWFDLLRARAAEFDLDENLTNEVLGPITLGMILQPSIAAAYESVSVPLAQHAERVSAAICRVLGAAWTPPAPGPPDSSPLTG
ncbi:MAG: TetR/AcrR family transcriptional regulator [bacterium]|nr:TetR/AcrR family transcriptional regulator [bacterium]